MRTKSLTRAFTILWLVLFASSTAQAGTNYAVLFSGGYNASNNYERYYTETKRMWDITKDKLGFPVENIYVLFADGRATGKDLNKGTLALPNLVDSDWSMIPANGHIAAGTATNLESTLANLATKIKSEEEDYFYFWSYDHGYNVTYSDNPPTPATRDSGGLCAWNEIRIADNTFASWVNPINAFAETYAFAECFSGDMVNELNIQTGESRFAAWAADWNEPSQDNGWADAWADGLVAGRRWTQDLGIYAKNNDPYRPGGSMTPTEHPGYVGDNFLIPEPGTIALLGLGGLMLRRRRG